MKHPSCRRDRSRSDVYFLHHWTAQFAQPLLAEFSRRLFPGCLLNAAAARGRPGNTQLRYLSGRPTIESRNANRPRR